MSTTDKKEIEDKEKTLKLGKNNVIPKTCLKSFDAVVNLNTIMFIDLLYI